MVVNRVVVLILFLMSAHVLIGQNRYMVFFKDKNNSPFEITSPEQFLSAKAIARRTQQNIPITLQDIPVNDTYLDAVLNTGANIFFRSRWMNGVLVQCDPSLVPTLEGLSMVDRVEFVAPDHRLLSKKGKASSRIKSVSAEVTDQQLSMLGINKMHQDGYRGEGVDIAIFDSGFSGVDVTSPFGHIFLDNRIKFSKDFITNSGNVYQFDDHGTMVFSVIAATIPSTFTGGAYKANYQLYVTEDVPTEYRIEEYNWLFAAERADSAGVDIIQSSLGYNTFDNSAMNYPTSAMDGETAVVTKAAQWAADRGIVVVVSAGNSGNSSWKIITAPADAVDVLAVANVNTTGQRAGTSSTGPSADGRIKPDVAALGTNTNVVNSAGGLTTVSGTSLAAPLITSLAAGIRQRYPDITAKQLLEAIRMAGSQAGAPDNQIGYGIPTYSRIVSYLEDGEVTSRQTDHTTLFEVYPNPFAAGSFIIESRGTSINADVQFELISAQGKRVHQQKIRFSAADNRYPAQLNDLPQGIYLLKINHQGKSFTYKVANQ